jgi:hypothetical protein
LSAQAANTFRMAMRRLILKVEVACSPCPATAQPSPARHRHRCGDRALPL